MYVRVHVSAHVQDSAIMSARLASHGYRDLNLKISSMSNDQLQAIVLGD